MCLQIDGEQYCAVLSNAPTYQGLSLERVQHKLEENQFPYTEEVVNLLAQTCGLSVDEYSRRLLVIRSNNAREQLALMRSGAKENYWTRGVYFFDFPPECGAYVRGLIHQCPEVPHISPEAQVSLRDKMKKRRELYFIQRIRRGMTLMQAREYPEFDSWGMLISNEARDVLRSAFRGELKREGPFIVINAMFYTPRKTFDLIISRWTHKRFSGIWHPAEKNAWRALLEPDDHDTYEQMLWEKARLESLPRESRGQKKLRRRAINAYKKELWRWRMKMQRKYLALLSQKLSEDGVSTEKETGTMLSRAA